MGSVEDGTPTPGRGEPAAAVNQAAAAAREAVARHYASGWTISQLAATFRISTETMRRYMVQEGIPRRPRGRPFKAQAERAGRQEDSITREEIIKRYHGQRQSIQVIAFDLRVSRIKVHRYMEREGIPRRPPGRPRKAEAPSEGAGGQEDDGRPRKAEAPSEEAGRQDDDDTPPKRRRRRRRVSNLDKAGITREAVATRYDAGESIHALAASLGVSDSALQRWMVREGIPRRPVGPRDQRRINLAISREDLIQRYHGHGQSIEAIAHDLEASAMAVYNKMVRDGIERRPPGRPRKPGPNPGQGAEMSDGAAAFGAGSGDEGSGGG
jgi:hypothetical protein